MTAETWVPPWAGFVQGLDVLGFPAAAGAAFLVAEDSPAALWAREALPPELVLEFRPHGSAATDPEPTTADLLNGSDLAAVLQAAGRGRLLLSCTRGTAHDAWSETHAIGLLAPPGTLARQLEDKIFFHRILQGLELPQPPGGVVERFAAVGDLPLGSVVQLPESLGGEGTFLIRTEDQRRAWFARTGVPAEGPFLVRKFLPGRAYGVTLTLTADAATASALRAQILLPDPTAVDRPWFAGIQWEPTRRFRPHAIAALDRALETLGRTLHGWGYRGPANFDFLLGPGGEISFLECNPRMSASTPQWLLHAETGGGPDAALELLRTLAEPPPATAPAAPRYVPIPPSEFAGATLETLPRLLSSPPAGNVVPAGGGTYGWNADRTALVRRGAPLDFVAPDDLFFLPLRSRPSADVEPISCGSILSRGRLFSAGGELLPAAVTAVACLLRSS